MWLFQPDNHNLVTAVASAAIAVFTALSVFITAFLVVENRRLRRIETDPELVAYLSPHPYGHGGVNFIISNIGRGVAKDISFVLEYDENDFREHSAQIYNDSERSNTNVLPQGEKIIALFGVGPDLFGSRGSVKSDKLKPFSVVLEYKDLHGRKRISKSLIDISQFAGLPGLSTKPTDREISESLDKMEKHFTKLTQSTASILNIVDVTRLSDDYRKKAKGGEI